SCLSQFQTMLRIPQIARALSKQSYRQPGDLGFTPALRKEISADGVDLEVIRERRFAVPDGDQLLNGSIDRLVLISRDGTPVAAEIIDFKTDALPENEQAIQDKIEHYRQQMAAYAYAVSTIYGLPPERIAARLVLLALGRVENVP